MTSVGRGGRISDAISSMPWIAGPPDVSDDAGDTATGPLIGPPNEEAQQAADDKYFGRDRVIIISEEESTITYTAPVPAEETGVLSYPVPPMSFENAVHNLYAYCEGVCLRKHKDYGHKNISAAPGGPLNGLRVRMHDKLSRINNLIDSGASPLNESLRDSFLDMANYSIIAMLVLDGDWPGCE